MSRAAVDAADGFYAEICDFSYKKMLFDHAGHFTQLVWNASKFIGIGIATTPDYSTYVVVVNYRPPGNYEDKSMMRTNIPPPVKETVKQFCDKHRVKAKESNKTATTIRVPVE